MNKPTPQERKEATLLLRQKHQKIFDALSIPEAVYIPKMAHHVKGLQGLHMGFFESELNHGEDVYTEMVSMQMESEDPTRTLYKYRYNPHFKDELEPSDEEPTASTRYYVPVEELEVVTMPVEEPAKKRGRPKKERIVTIPNDPRADQPMDQMTLRDHACLTLRVPESSKVWLNELIIKANKQTPF